MTMTQPPSVPRPGLSVPQVARRLRRSEATVWRWIGEGRLRAERMGSDSPRGGITYVPLTALVGFRAPKRGRPPRTRVAG